MMQITGTLYLCVCLTFVSVDSTEVNETTTALPFNNTEPNNDTMPTVTTPLPSGTPGHTFPSNDTANVDTTASPLDPSTLHSTGATVSSQNPTIVPSEATSNPGTSVPSTHNPTAETADTKTTTGTTATTPKGGSPSLFGGCSQLLGPVISILIYIAQG